MISTDLSTLELKGGFYRTELARTLSHAFKLCAAHPELGPKITKETAHKFAQRVIGMTIEQMEDHLYALQNQNPELLLQAMQAAGHDFKRDSEGNVTLNQPSDLRALFGRPVTVSEEDFG